MGSRLQLVGRAMLAFVTVPCSRGLYLCKQSRNALFQGLFFPSYRVLSYHVHKPVFFFMCAGIDYSILCMEVLCTHGVSLEGYTVHVAVGHGKRWGHSC